MGKLPPKKSCADLENPFVFKETLQEIFQFFFKNLVHLHVRVKCPEIHLRNNVFELKISLGPNFPVKIIVYRKIYLLNAAKE